MSLGVLHPSSEGTSGLKPPVALGGEIAARTAYELLKPSNGDAQRQLAEQAAAGTLTVGDVSNAVRKRAGKPKAAPRGTRQVFVAENGWKITVTARQMGSYDEIEQALRLTLEEEV